MGPGILIANTICTLRHKHRTATTVCALLPNTAQHKMLQPSSNGAELFVLHLDQDVGSNCRGALLSPWPVTYFPSVKVGDLSMLCTAHNSPVLHLRIPLYSILRSMLRPISLVPSSSFSEPQYRIITPVLGSDALSFGIAVLTFICVVVGNWGGLSVCVDCAHACRACSNQAHVHSVCRQGECVCWGGVLLCALLILLRPAVQDQHPCWGRMRCHWAWQN
jgi:hypothetical protein